MANQTPPANSPQSGRGGRRPGAGRKPKAKIPRLNIGELADVLATPTPAEIDQLARGEARRSIAALAELLAHGTSETARISAATEILDRGWGKPAVEIGGDSAMLPFALPPSREQTLTTTSEIRAEAQKFGPLAIRILTMMRDGGSSENVRSAAARALLNRGLGTVGKAKMPDEQREQPLGKKENASRAAEMAATGRYATPPAPRGAIVDQEDR